MSVTFACNCPDFRTADGKLGPATVHYNLAELHHLAGQRGYALPHGPRTMVEIDDQWVSVLSLVEAKLKPVLIERTAEAWAACAAARFDH